MPPAFGEIPGVREGDLFDDRHALHLAQVHRPLQAGISGTRDAGADSIVLSGGYEDDLDLGDSLVYTGHGGNNPLTGKQDANQQMLRGNLAMARSCLDGRPVRVVRGSRHRSEWSPPYGYVYAGLFRVSSFWSEVGQSGWVIWRFSLEKLGTGEQARPGHWLREDDPDYDVGAAPRQPTVVQRIVRATALGAAIKSMYDYQCQVWRE